MGKALVNAPPYSLALEITLFHKVGKWSIIILTFGGMILDDQDSWNYSLKDVSSC